EGFGQAPAIGARFEVSLDLFIPRFASGERAAGENHEDLVAIHRLSPVSKRSDWPGVANTTRTRVVANATSALCYILAGANRASPVRRKSRRIGRGGGERGRLMARLLVRDESKVLAFE